MIILEILSYLSNIAMAIAVVYTAFSIHTWRRQSVISRRADNANEILEELEFFYLELEQLVSCHYLLDWKEWGTSFKETLRTNFLIPKLKAERLKDETINLHLQKMQRLAIKLPASQRLSTQLDPQDQLFWKKESSKAAEDFNSDWEEYKKTWSELKELLSKEALYEMPSKTPKILKYLMP